ncbi:MAG: hypothetical protein J6X30_02125, partial [Clostridia bacterium]|nr:hypothetical protein [Clostridia bacterium]
MKTKVLAIMLSLCMALGVCTSVVQAGPIVQSGVSVLYMNQVSEEEEPYVTTERTEYTKMIAVCGDEGSEYTLTEDVSDVVFLVNNTMVTLGEGGGYAMAGLLGTASLTDGNLVLTPPYGTPAFTGDPTVFEEWATFFENEVENAFIPLATYNGDLAQDHQFPYSNLTVHGNLTVSGDWMYQENLTVDGNLTVQTIFSVENAAVSGNIFIQAPEGGDPNGLNILWGGSLTLGGTFTADDGQIFELVDNAAVYGDVPLYVFDGEGLVPFVLESEHKLLDFTYVAAESAFVKQENGGGDDDGELREFDARLDYDHSRALITVLIDGAEPFTVYGGERFFFTYDDQPHPLCFSIDTARNAWGELEEEEQIHDLSVSVFYYYKGANDDIWMMDCIVRAGEATDERFTFENNTLSFTPASTAPFYMEICLTEEEYAFATMSPEEGEVLLEYYIEGFGGVTEGAAKHRVHAFGNTKMIFDLTDRATVFTNITPQEGESLIGFRFQYEYFFLDNEADMARLAENGAVYDAEAGTLTVTFDPEEPYMDLVFWFSGGDPGPGGDLNDFDARVNYDDNRVAIVAQIGETDPFDVRSWDRFLFAPEGELQPVSLTIDTTRSIWRELSEEERVQDMSVFIVCRWRDHEDRNVWHEAYIVRAGVVEEAYRAQYTFENNELSFLPETGEPFELEVYLNESELVFNQIQPDEGEVLIQYDSNGRGSFSVSGYKDAAYMGGMTKMIFDAANETILFTEINPAEGEELIGVRFMDEEYRFDNPGDLARLAGCGVTYDAEAHTLTVTMNPEQPYLYLTIRFSDYGSSWLGTGQFALQYRYGFGRVLFARDAEELLPIPAGPAIDYAAESTLRFELDYRYDPNGYPIEKDSNCYIADEDISPWILLRDEWTHQEMWIVETGVVPEHLQAQFTFEDNTLIFQTENAHPFTLSVFWTDEDK